MLSWNYNKETSHKTQQMILSELTKQLDKEPVLQT